MKNAFSLLCFTLIASFLNAQTYGNEWIDYNETHYKVKVVNDGVYKLSNEALENNGYPMPVIGSELVLIHFGERVPLYVSETGIWNDDDFLYFYGERNDGHLDQQLYENPDWHHNPEFSMFTDTAVYYLRKDIDNPSPNYTVVENDLDQNLLPAEEYYIAKESIVMGGKNSSTAIQFSNGQPDPVQIFSTTHHPDTFNSSYSGIVNYYSPNYTNGEGLVGYMIQRPPPNPNGSYKNIPLEFSSFKPATSESTTIEFTTMGFSSSFSDTTAQDHHFKAEFKGQSYIDMFFDGYETVDQNITISDPLLPMNETETLKISVHGPDIDRVALFDINYTYPRKFELNEESVLDFDLNVDPLDGNYLEIESALANEEFILLDKTENRIFFLESQSDGILKVFIPSSTSAELELTLVQNSSSEDFYTVNDIYEIDFVNYGLQEGDYIFISHPKFLVSPSIVSYYTQIRESELGGSHITTIVDVEQLYDQYAYGIRKHPLSIKRFINMAKETWSISPEHLLLIGKGYVNYKSRVNPTLFENNLIPVWGASPTDRYYSSDDFRATSSIATGRIAVTTEAQLLDYINKVIEHSNVTTDQIWRNNVLHIEGGNGSYQTEFFYKELDELADELSGSNFNANTFRYPIPPLGSDFVSLNEMLTLNGTSIVTFLGHAASFVWNADLEEVSEYDMSGRYPFMISLANFNGQIYDNTSQPSMPESFLLEPNNGAIGFLGFPNYVQLGSVSELGLELYKQIGEEMYGETIGKQINQTIENLYNPDSAQVNMMLDTWTLHGDPALVLKSSLNTSISESELVHNIEISPNPFFQEITFTSVSLIGTEVLIYDHTGKLIFSGYSADDQFKWNATNQSGMKISNGIYQVSFLQKGEIISSKTVLKL